MSARTVTSQAELDQAIKDKIEWIEIRSPAGVLIDVPACGSSTVRACGSSTVRAYDSSTVRACGSSTVRAYGSSTVRACGSSTVTAYDSSTVRACGSSTVRAYDSSTVRATPLVAVHLRHSTARVTGGVILDHTHVDAMGAREWCKYYGVEVNRGIATLYKAVDDTWTTDRGTDYSPGSKPSCDDWNPEPICGGGLHFGPTPAHALAYHSEATKFVAVGVRVADLVPIPGNTAKAKALRVVRACVECDINGKPVEVTP